MNRLIAGFAVVLSVLLYGATLALAAPQTTIAKSAIVVDLSSGTLLLDKDSAVRMPTASMSKTMTVYMIFDAIKNGRLKLDTTCPVSEKAWKMEGSKMFVVLDSQIPVEDLLKGVIVQSGNDATVVLAECLSGSEERFAAEMTAKAREIGMTGSNFMNASGWPHPEHYSTPRDLALLTWRLISDFPEYYHYFAIKEFTWNNITQQNRDPLLGKVEGADGLKTGHTEEAGYGLIGSAQRGGRRVIMVLSGLTSMKDRESEGMRLMNWALDSFKRARLYKAGAEVGRAKVIYGLSRDVPLVLADHADMTIPIRLTPQEIAASVQYESPIIAPLKKGERVGSMKVTVPDIGTQEFPVVTGADIAQKSFIGRTFEKIILAVGADK